MTTGFPTNTVLTLWRAGQDDLLPEGMEFFWRGGHLRHKPGGHTDGMSSPQFTHILADANPRGWAFMAAVAHDGGYHRDIEQLHSDGQWKPFSMDKDMCDTMFLELLQSVAIDEKQRLEALAFYEAVKLGGQSSYDAGAK